MQMGREFAMTIGERIKQKRIEANLSQDELAKKVGYKSRSSIQKIEAARNLPINKVEKMALALDCDPGYLMGWTDDPESKPIRVGEDETLVLFGFNPEQRKELIDFYNSFKNASPDVQNAIRLLLKSRRSDA